MTIKRVCAAAVGALMIAGSLVGCSLVSVNPEKDMNQIVATVNGTEIKKQEYQDMLQQYIEIYQMFGMDLASDPEMMTQMKKDILESLVENQVIMQKAKELGFDKLTAEEQAEIDKDFDEQIKGYRENFRADAEAEKEKDANVDVEKKIDELFEADMKAQGVDRDLLKSNIVEQKLYEKVQEDVYKLVTVGDDEVKKYFDEQVATQKEALDADKSGYEANVSSGAAYYAPEGLYFVKHILVKIPEDADKQKAISDKEAEQKTWSEEMSQLIVADKEGNTAKIDELTKKINDSKLEVTTLKNELMAPVKAKADEVLAKVQAGEDFDALIEQYGEDEGMKAEPGKTNGYIYYEGITSYVEPFAKASAALKAKGETSGLVESEFGYHIIKRYEDVAPGVVDFASVQESCKEAVTTNKNNDQWQKSVDEWKAAAKVVRFEDKLNDNSAGY